MKLEEADKNMKVVEFDPNSIVYYDPIKSKKFKIKGLAFFEKEHKYFRLPTDCKDKVSEAVYWLANHPSGGQIRFRTNAKKIVVKIENTGDYQMCHMPATSQQGVDLYYKLKGQKKYTFFECAKFNIPTVEFESPLFDSDEKMDKDIIINLPLYEGLGKILIGIEADAKIYKAKERKDKEKIVYYGTSITQGGCVSRPGLSFTNILSRKLNTEFINLGFSGSGLGEPELAEIITQIDNVKMIVLDYEGNGGCTGHLEKYMEEFIDILRKKWPIIPIVIITKTWFTNYVFLQNEVAARKRLYDFQLNVVNQRNAKGDNNIYFIDGSKLFGNEDIDECLIDGIHPGDLGFYRIAKNLEPKLKKILNK